LEQTKVGLSMKELEKLLLYSLVSVCVRFLEQLNLDEWDDPIYDEMEELISDIVNYVGEP